MLLFPFRLTQWINHKWFYRTQKIYTRDKTSEYAREREKKIKIERVLLVCDHKSNPLFLLSHAFISQYLLFIWKYVIIFGNRDCLAAIKSCVFREIGRKVEAKVFYIPVISMMKNRLKMIWAMLSEHWASKKQKNSGKKFLHTKSIRKGEDVENQNIFVSGYRARCFCCIPNIVLVCVLNNWTPIYWYCFLHFAVYHSLVLFYMWSAIQ